MLFNNDYTASAQLLMPADSTSVRDSTLTSPEFKFKVDSLNKKVQLQIITERVNRSGIDTVVVYKASDSIIFNIKSQKMRLRGNAEIKYKTQQLNAEIIEMSFKTSEMTSQGYIDSNRKLVGYPKFADEGEEYFGENIKFNFKSGQGVIAVGETQINDGFYFGTKIKRMSQTEMFVQGGYYTTCDQPEPHFHFGSSKMKIIADDRVLLDPLVLYVEDLPVFIVPFGLFFPTQSGRQSGLIVPSFFFSQSRGVVFQNLGFYWAASDYWDTQIKTDLYSKGGFMLKNQTRWALRNEFIGNMDLEYGLTRFNVDDEYTTNWRFRLNHNQDFTPSDKVVVNLDFTSSNFNRNTLVGNQQYITQNIRSSASYTKNFDNRTTLSLAFDRDQNIITDGYSQNASARYNLPTSRFFSGVKSLPRWVRDISFSYSTAGIYQGNKNPFQTIDSTNDDPPLFDTTNSFNYSTRYRIEHNPSISINPKLGFFTVSPFISFRMNNYFRKIKKTYDPLTATLTIDTATGFFTEYNYGTGVNVQTKLYGVTDDSKPFFGFIKPSSIGIKAARHVYNPSIGYVITPDQSSDEIGFYGRYVDTLNREVLYSRFEIDGGGIASRGYSSAIRYSDMHSFELKIAQKDTLPDVNVEILRLNLSTAYDFARDSLNLSDLNIGFRSPSLKLIDFNGSANFKFYDEESYLRTDSISGETTRHYNMVNKYLISEGKGLMRLTNLSLSFSTTFSSAGIDFGTKNQESPADSSALTKDSVEFGKRFQARYDSGKDIDDIFGDSSPGYSSMNVPWNLSLGLVYNYSRFSINPASKSESINLRFSANLKLTETWSINTNGGYDFVGHEFNVPQINFIKDLHCWELMFNWTPIGGNAGFYFKLGIKAPQLRDLKYELQDSPLMR